MKHIVWLNRNQRDTDVSWRAGDGASLHTGQTLATAVVGPKAVDRSKDLNVCSFQYVDNGLSFSR